ncbi:hypothetical protein BpHYR1_013694 [Brachionus plicatilis]|uniref:Uncharacterized protein n=1 Tax=Brachionus plicatilis TaxID=10195 RepID=A0A3M7RU39_BRAPC|nr:hypothetical protein BpHYR1_013694 [Brachionus plicatilis]
MDQKINLLNNLLKVNYDCGWLIFVICFQILNIFMEIPRQLQFEEEKISKPGLVEVEGLVEIFIINEISCEVLEALKMNILKCEQPYK